MKKYKIHVKICPPVFLSPYYVFVEEKLPLEAIYQADTRKYDILCIISDFVMEFKYLRRWHIAVVILYILACGSSVNEKEESAVYVSSERAELKSHFVCGISPRCFRRVAAYTRALQGALRTNEWPNSRGNKEFVRALNIMANRTTVAPTDA